MNVLHETGGARMRRRSPTRRGRHRWWASGRRMATGSGAIIAPDTVLTAAQTRGRAPTWSSPRTRSAASPWRVDEDLGIAALRVETGDVGSDRVGPTRCGAGDRNAGVRARESRGDAGCARPRGWCRLADRSFRGPTGRRIVGALEHTAPLPRGSAGGPLLDVEGRLLGLNVLRLEGGLILALSQGLRRGGRGARRAASSRGGRGSESRSRRRGRREDATRGRASGARRRARAGGRGREPAQDAGLAQGDLIVGAGGDAVDGIDALYRALDGSGMAGSWR